MTNEIQKSVAFVETASVNEIANSLMLNINDRCETIASIVAIMNSNSFGVTVAATVAKNPEKVSQKQAYCIAYAIIENKTAYYEAAKVYEQECLKAFANYKESE